MVTQNKYQPSDFTDMYATSAYHRNSRGYYYGLTKSPTPYSCTACYGEVEESDY